MKAAERVLVAIDDSSASERAVSYLARLLGGKKNLNVELFHVVEPIPPYFISMQGDLKTELRDRPEEAEKHLVEEAKTRSRPVIEKMLGILESEGIDRECVEASWFVAGREDSLDFEILQRAREKNHRTVVVGHTSLPWYRELFRHHVGERIVKKGEGLSVWVVE